MGLTIIDTKNIYHNEVIGNVRQAQEDSHDIAALTPNGDVFVVCDGMGGHVGGKCASSIAVRSIIEYLKKEKYSQPIQALNDALQYANVQILDYAKEHPELRGMGTTACVVLLQDSETYIAHVGDSRIYLYLGKEKQLHRVTKDHSYVQALVDANRISDEEAEHHPNKNRILKALGIKTDLEPSFDTIRPKNEDIFLICSDGLNGMISDKVIAEVLSGDDTVSQKGDSLINLALEAGGLDNITLELIQISSSPHPKSVFPSYNPAGDTKPQSLIKGSKALKIIIILLSAVIACAAMGGLVYLMSKNKAKEEKERIEQAITKINEKLENFRREQENVTEEIRKIENKFKG